MTDHLPFAFPIRVSDALLVELGEFTGHHWNDTLGMEPFVAEALRNYMKPAPVVQQQAAAPSESGYQWKEVFLPEGTRLRASFDHKQYFAVVAGAEIKYGEHAISPSCFANLYGSGNRNAWQAVWLRLPGSDAWLLADVCRAAQKAAIARLMQGDAPQAGQSSPALSGAPQAEGAPTRAGGAPAARPPEPRATEVRPAGAKGAKGAARSEDTQRKQNPRRKRRRHHRAKKHINVTRDEASQGATSTMTRL